MDKYDHLTPEWYAEHTRLWKAYGDAIRAVPSDGEIWNDPDVIRARDELEAHDGGPWMPVENRHGTLHGPLTRGE